MHVAGSLPDKQRTTKKNSGVDGSLTNFGDAQKESENKAFIPVFDPIQSVKSTKTVMLRYTRVSQKSGISTLASLSNAKPHMRSACDWVRLTGKQSTRENNGVDGVTYVL